MEEMLSFIGKGYTIVDVIVVIGLIVAFVRAIERFGKWIGGKLNSYYKRKKGVEDKNDTIESHSKDIQALTERIDRLVAAVTDKYDTLVAKIDEQQERLEQIDEDGKRRDCAVLRDRILSGVRYFSQNKDDNGIVHINITDYENMAHLFEEYFACNGNGAVKSLYEKEFKSWTIDN